MRLTRNCKIDTTNLSQEQKELAAMFPNYDYARNELGFAISDTQMLLEKLGQLEDIEEELGIDLITLFKALKYPIYVKEKDETWWCSNRLYFGLGQAFIVIIGLDDKDIILPLKDYGKTWALTKEELL